MGTVVEWAMWGVLLLFAIILCIGFIGLLFSGPDVQRVERRKTKNSLGSVFLAGILLGMWLDDD
ncbi:hypothetical protein [Candidatus Ferrigenium straubiae]|jgi:hypothetical protein|uniref:hypothetical protein n=1 Tax=Candidatus Ferrigenium straubiae TaxID=2919506 RepID=UPI003F4ABE38